MKTCPTCQKTYPDDFSICPRDGAQLTAQATETEAQLAAGLSRRFRIIRQLGKGGMGTVFLAEQIGVGNRPVALKVLNRKLLDDADFLARFQNEAGSTGRIHHPNVVTIHESGQGDDGTPYIAMEFLEGESLREVIERRGAFPLTEVAEILQQAARGLNAAHKLGIIHRDLKPDNIFLTYGYDESVAPVFPPASKVSPPANIQVKIVDFGIAKLRESSTHTMTGTVLGTPAYMSYEQASGMRSDELDARSDVYSMGVVVYEMLTGRLPFQSSTPVGYLRMHMQEAPPRFRATNPDLPALPQVESVVMKALVKDRNQRYGSVLEFARAFAEAADARKAVVGAVREPPLRDHDTMLQATVLPTAHPAISAMPDVAATRPRLILWVGIFAAAFLLMLGGWYVSSMHSHRSAPIQSASVQTPQASVLLHEWDQAQPLGKLKLNSKDGLTYVWIPPGTFMMGCSSGDSKCASDEKPPHQVTMTKGFWLGQTEVTVAAYKHYAASTGRQMPFEPNLNGRLLNPGWADETMPIVDVGWDEAQAYCSWAGGRLPTEAEWEYAARARSTASRYGDLEVIAWDGDNSGRERMDSDKEGDGTNYWKRLEEKGNAMHEVGQKQANAFGLYDILGNAGEWVNDWYDRNYYQTSPSIDPPGPTSETGHILRGGSWVGGPSFVRVSNRGAVNAGYAGEVGGFRCGGEVFAP